MTDDRGSFPDGRSGGKMGCDSVRPLLIPYLDGEAAPAEAAAVEAHAAECPACARALEVHRGIGQALELSSARRVSSAVPPGLARRAREEARRRVRIARAGWLSLAAGLAIAFGGIALWRPWSPPSGIPAGAGDDLIGNLEVLESFEEEGLEPSEELVQLLLEGDVEERDAGSVDVFDPSIFQILLEEEVSLENL